MPVSKPNNSPVMVWFQVQILTNFTYHVGYKPIFTSHVSKLLIKQAKKQNTVIIDTPIRILFDDRIFSLLLLSLECRWGDLKGCQ